MTCNKAVADKVVKSGHILDVFFIEEITSFSFRLEVGHKKMKDCRDNKEETAGCLPLPPSSLITKSHYCRWQFSKVNLRKMRRGVGGRGITFSNFSFKWSWSRTCKAKIIGWIFKKRNKLN